LCGSPERPPWGGSCALPEASHLALQVGQRPAGRRARGRQPLQKMWPQVEESTRRPGEGSTGRSITSGQDGGEGGEADGAVEAAKGAGVPRILGVARIPETPQ
jgi:hypothetical protein